MSELAPSLAEAPDAVFRVWRHRRRIEFEAAAAFRGLARDLGEIYGAGDAVAHLALKAADDEIRHAELCAQILMTSADGESLVEAAPATFPALGPATLAPRARALFAAVAMGCVTESLSTRLLIEMQTRAQGGLVRQTIHDIAVDEVTHARVGWATLAREAADGDIRWLGDYVPAMIAAALNDEIDPLSPVPAPSDRRDFSPWGILPRDEARGLMIEVVEEVIRPGLKHFGVVFDEECGRLP